MVNKKGVMELKRHTNRQNGPGGGKKKVINEDNTAQVINGCAIWTIIGECLGELTPKSGRTRPIIKWGVKNIFSDSPQYFIVRRASL